jgi:two-component system, LytTR family, response regulator
MLKAVIIDDEMKGLSNLTNALGQHCTDVQVIGTADSIAEGFALLSQPHIKPDVAFLDINLSDGLVFQLLEKLRPIPFDIIFVTAHESHAVKACNFSAIGYILKPIDSDELIEAVARIRPGKPQEIDKRTEVFKNIYTSPSQSVNNFEKMFISTVEGVRFVALKDIVRLEGYDNYTHIHLLTGERLMTSKTIKVYEGTLANVNFFRVHKSNIINTNHIEKFIKTDGGYLLMSGGTKVAVSRRRKPAFLEHMRQLQRDFGME